MPTFVGIGDVLLEKYEIIKLLGQGGYGEVFQVKEINSAEMYAAKIELFLPIPGVPGLDVEMEIMKVLQNCGHVVRFVEAGKFGLLNVMIMQLVGCNLSELRWGCPEKKFTTNTAVHLAMQCLDCIESLHGAGVLHRDLKPGNFAIGRTAEDCRKVYVLDFGTAKIFSLQDGQCIAKRASCKGYGTVKYISLSCHVGLDPGRIDDMWSWLYMFIAFLKGELPWDGETNLEKIRFSKMTSKGILCGKLPPQITEIYTALQLLKFDDDPPYAWLKQKLTEMVQTTGVTPFDPLDWEENGAFHEQLKTLIT